MQRIVILGNAGSGKSTLARQIGARLGAPVVHLDTLFWEAGWVEADAKTFRARVREAVAGEAWVCEGNYARRTFDLRLPRADLVIWLDTPQLTCLKRVILRSVLNKPRPDLPAGCSERLDRAFLEFLKFVWTFDRGYRPGIEAMRQAVGPQVPVVHVQGRRQIEALLADLRQPVSTARAQ
ncbi:TPA: AAA family ATPase [Pseudomonas putida]|nr:MULTISPECIES: ATPase AAA [Pseudomonas]APF01672.1 AAA family ATPase [Pseudomonas putida]MBP0707141.1 AAA family ATPase [Pseudomonas sp. T34]MCE0999454.1 AAA family ATPase [Pseudomonas sp. NMI1173_11]MCK2186581.1 AAA family ATPase [Pseudomonas sp. MB04B]MDD2083312.1 AAA family ATPase [Pseudomonas putida]